MGYLLRGLRLASYLAAALGLLLFLGGIINNALFFYGIRFLFIGLVGIAATTWLRDRYLEGAEEEQYNSFLPSQEIVPKVRTPNAIQSVLFRWYDLSTVEKGFVIVFLIVGAVVLIVLFYMMLIWIGVLIFALMILLGEII